MTWWEWLLAAIGGIGYVRCARFIFLEALRMVPTADRHKIPADVWVLIWIVCITWPVPVSLYWLKRAAWGQRGGAS